METEMEMTVREMLKEYNKFVEKFGVQVTLAMGIAVMTFAAWQVWMQAMTNRKA